jgi:hypothetical protein
MLRIAPGRPPGLLPPRCEAMSFLILAVVVPRGGDARSPQHRQSMTRAGSHVVLSVTLGWGHPTALRARDALPKEHRPCRHRGKANTYVEPPG